MPVPTTKGPGQNDDLTEKLNFSWSVADERESRWERVTASKLAGFVIGSVLFLIVLLKSEPGFVFLLDFANLLFHEAGHPIYGLLNRRFEIYGGTLGQLTFPIILMISFWRKGHPISFAVCWIWLFENFLNIARYMADSRELVLPLVGGGEHDWNEIFARWKILSHDTTIASITRAIGWIGMAAAVLWVIFRSWRDRRASGSLKS
jgi:hypothetical protein